MQLLDAGQDYDLLNSSFIIFICRDAVFDCRRHIYTFRSCCLEDPSLILEDGTTRIFLSAAGKLDDVSPQLKAFLDYVAGTISDDSYVQEVDLAVRRAKANRKWRHEYMTLEMKERIVRRQAYAEGKNNGIIIGMILAFRQNQLTDSDIAMQLMQRFSLSEYEILDYMRAADEADARGDIY